MTALRTSANGLARPAAPLFALGTEVLPLVEVAEVLVALIVADVERVAFLAVAEAEAVAVESVMVVVYMVEIPVEVTEPVDEAPGRADPVPPKMANWFE